MDLTLLFGFLVLSALLSVIPGPSVILATGRAITQGSRAAVWIVFGNALGGLVLLGLVIVGLGAVIAASAALFTVVKVLGAIYLLWLGLRALWSARRSSIELDGVAGGQHSRGRLLRQGFLVGVSNPKSIVSLMAVLPQFVDPALGSVAVQMLIIGLAGGVVQLVIEGTWVFAAGTLRSWFRRRPNRIKTVQAAGGLAMIGLAGKLAFQRSTA